MQRAQSNGLMSEGRVPVPPPFHVGVLLCWWHHHSLHSMPMLHYFLLICFGCKSRGVFNGVQAMLAETTSNFIHLAEL